jgi:hypothetical protein
MAMKNDEFDRDANADPITGEPGSHPVGAGLGAAAGGAAAGAAAGAMAGPVGTVVGTVAGGVLGGLAGKEVAEHIDPTVEEHYWRNEYPNRDYYDPKVRYDDVGPAYQYGWESRGKYHDRTWDEAEADLATEWHTHRGKSTLDWQQANRAARDAWDRVDLAHKGEGADARDDANREHIERVPRTPK